MISITTHRLLIVYRYLILQKNEFFPYWRNLALVVVPFTCLIPGPFGLFLTQNFVCFFKYSLNFQGHAPKFELNKVWHANFIEFKYERTNPQNEWAFEKTNKPCFYLHFAKSNLKVISFTLLFWTSKRNYFMSGIYTKFMCSITFSYSHDCKKCGKKSIFSKKINFLWTQLDGRIFGFSPAGPKTKVDPPDSQQ